MVLFVTYSHMFNITVHMDLILVGAILVILVSMRPRTRNSKRYAGAAIIGIIEYSMFFIGLSLVLVGLFVSDVSWVPFFH